MTPTATFTCNICGEPSGAICIYCTKDVCANHICDKCQRCSDCCECEVHLNTAADRAYAAAPLPVPAVAAEAPHAVLEEAVPAREAPPEPVAVPARPPSKPDWDHEAAAAAMAMLFAPEADPQEALPRPAFLEESGPEEPEPEESDDEPKHHPK